MDVCAALALFAYHRVVEREVRYGECGRHPGHNMANCPACSIEKMDIHRYPGNLRNIRVDDDAPPAFDLEKAVTRNRGMAEARRLLATFAVGAEDDVHTDGAGNTLVTAGRTFVRWPDMDNAVAFYKRLNPSGHNVFPVATYHLCVANWLVGVVCGTTEPETWGR